MEGRRSLTQKRKTSSLHSRHLKSAQRQERRCLTDTEEVAEDVGCRRYSCTVFPLFSKYSVDEVLMSKPSPQLLPRPQPPLSAPTRKPPKAKSSRASTEDSPDVAPVAILPIDCLLKVFSYLGVVEKGKCMRVCKAWHIILLSPSCWKSVKLWDFPLTCMVSADHLNNQTCFSCYTERIHRFTEYLLQLKPKLRRLEFKFDIGICRQSEFALLFTDLTDNLDLSELQYLELNWKDTPLRPFWLLYDSNASCSDIIDHQRRRGSTFTELFDQLTKKATRIQVLALPFAWNERSVKCITRLKSLHTLVLEKYFVFKTLEQRLLDCLLDGLPSLKKLILEIWCPCGLHNMPLFNFASESLVQLDISQSKGFYLKSVNLPRLESLRISRPVWHGPLEFRGDTRFPCLYKILVAGAPSLVKLNDHYLQSDWKEQCYSTLDEVLKSICSCLRHKTGWLM